MSRAAAVLGALLLAACAGDPQPEPPAEAGELSQADAALDAFAGHWTATYQFEGVTDPVMVEFHGSGTDWVATVSPDRDPVPMTVTMAGDSLVAETAVFESVLRPGAMVKARTAGVLVDGRMMGTSVLTYEPDGQPEMVQGTFTAERTPEGMPAEEAGASPE